MAKSKFQIVAKYDPDLAALYRDGELMFIGTMNEVGELLERILPTEVRESDGVKMYMSFEIDDELIRPVPEDLQHNPDEYAVGDEALS